MRALGEATLVTDEPKEDLRASGISRRVPDWLEGLEEVLKNAREYRRIGCRTLLKEQLEKLKRRVDWELKELELQDTSPPPPTVRKATRRT